MLTAALNLEWPNQPLRVMCHLAAKTSLYSFVC